MVLRHGADASYVGKYSDAISEAEGAERRGNALHALCDATPRLGHVNSSLLLLLLRHGADADACVDGRHPLTSYFDALCRGRGGSQNDALEESAAAERTRRQESAETRSGGSSSQNAALSAAHASDQPRRSVSFPAAAATSGASDDVSASELITDVRRMCRVLGFMSLSSQRLCAKALQARLTSLSSSSPPQTQWPPARPPFPDGVTAGLRHALREVEKYTLVVPSLRRSCAAVVWRHCRRHVGNVYKLPVPMPLINDVMDSL